MIDCLYFFPAQRDSIVYVEKASNLSLALAFMATEQWGFFTVPHLKWHNLFLFKLIYDNHVWLEVITYCGLITCLSKPGLEHILCHYRKTASKLKLCYEELNVGQKRSLSSNNITEFQKSIFDSIIFILFFFAEKVPLSKHKLSSNLNFLFQRSFSSSCLWMEYMGRMSSRSST